MNSTLTVAARNEPLTNGEYDLLICSLGYEERARYLAETRQVSARRKIAWEFPSNQVMSFDSNRQLFEREHFEVVSPSEIRLHEWFRANNAIDRPFKVCVDISSASRVLIAQVIDTARRLSSHKCIDIDFFYSAAEFVAPHASSASNVWAGPVLPSFAGWSVDPSLPSVLILGLGYEPDRAIGAVEYIEPAEVISFEPVSSQEEFTPAVAAANKHLSTLNPAPRRMRYRVENPFSTILQLDGLLGRLVQRSRPVILPFGPKVFALASLLTAVWYPGSAVWRVSAGEEEQPVQRIATGEIFGLNARFGIVSNKRILESERFR